MPSVHTVGLDDLIGNGVTVIITPKGVHLYYEEGNALQQNAAIKYYQDVQTAIKGKSDLIIPELHASRAIATLRVPDNWFQFEKVLKATGAIYFTNMGIQVFWNAESKAVAETLKSDLQTAALKLTELSDTGLSVPKDSHKLV